MPDKAVTVSAVFVPAAFPFVDVKTGDWFYDYVVYVYANGLVTREQFATMLYRYVVAKGYDVSIGESTNILSYADFASISEYAIPAMQWACGSGVITGVTDLTLEPAGSATRA